MNKNKGLYEEEKNRERERTNKRSSTLTVHLSYDQKNLNAYATLPLFYIKPLET